MKSIRSINKQLVSGQFEFTRHAFKRAVERNISETELIEVGKNAKIIEKYSEDKYSPSCLILGFTKTGRPLHLQVSLAETNFLKSSRFTNRTKKNGSIIRSGGKDV